jgi:hypothetical protein
VFRLDVAKVDLDVAYVCNGYTPYVTSVSSKYFICFIRTLQVFHLDVEKVDADLDLTSELCRCSARSRSRATTRGICMRRKKGKASNSIQRLDVVLLGRSGGLFGGSVSKLPSDGSVPKERPGASNAQTRKELEEDEQKSLGNLDWMVSESETNG